MITMIKRDGEIGVADQSGLKDMDALQSLLLVQFEDRGIYNAVPMTLEWVTTEISWHWFSKRQACTKEMIE